MRGILRYSLLAPVIALACAPYQKFTPTGTTAYDPLPDGIAIPLLETAPDRPHEIIGYVECFATSTEQALPMLQKQARLNGGEALLNLTSQPREGLASAYRAAVVRYVPPAP